MLSLPWRARTSVPGGWPRLPRPIARFSCLRPDIAEAYNNLGNVLLDQGKLDEAAAQYEQAVALKPDLFQAHNNLGNILAEQGKLDQAVARFEQALALKPDLAEAHNNLGNVSEGARQVRRGGGTLRSSTGPQAGLRRSPLPSRRSENLSRRRSRSRRARSACRRPRPSASRQDAVHPLRARQGAGRRRRLSRAPSSIGSRAMR